MRRLAIFFLLVNRYRNKDAPSIRRGAASQRIVRTLYYQFGSIVVALLRFTSYHLSSESRRFCAAADVKEEADGP
jgi:hypothetical protein